MTRAIGFAAATRVAVLLAGLAAAVSIGYEMRPDRFRLSHNELWALPGRFDAGWYLGIARRGYHWNPAADGHQQNVAFFPAFPIAMRAAGEIVTLPAHLAHDPELFGNGDTRIVWGGALLSMGCFLAACVLLIRLSATLLPDADAGDRAVLLLASYPFALFYSAAFSEGMFLLAAVAAFLDFEQGRPVRGSAWGLLAGLTRSNGWAVAAGLLLIVWRSRERRARLGWWLAALAPVAGTAVFSAYCWRLTGDPLAWVSVQEGWGNRADVTAFVMRRIAVMQSIGISGYVRADPVDVWTVASVLFALAMSLVAWRRLGPAYALFSAAYLGPAILVNGPSIGRYGSVLFPSFLAAATLLSRRQTIAASAACLIVQLWMATRFFTWQTPY